MIKDFSCIVFFMTFSMLCFSQKLDYGVHSNMNRFYEFALGGVDQNFQLGFGYGFEVGLSDLRISKKNSARLTAGFTNYYGTMSIFILGIDDFKTLNAALTKNIIHIGFYPLLSDQKKLFHFNLGTEISYLLNQKLNGQLTQFGNGARPINETFDLVNHNGEEYTRRFNLALKANFFYEIEFENVTIKPTLGVSNSVLKEINFGRKTYLSFRTNFGVIFQPRSRKHNITSPDPNLQ